MDRLYIVIGCDTDPDRRGYLDGVPSGTLTWRGMTEGIPRLKELVRGLTDGSGHEPILTWLLRVDEQVRKIHGGYGWVLTNHGGLLASLEGSGDELGWHPHFWRLDEARNCWYQELQDVDWQVAMLEHAHREFVSVFPGRAKSVRMGWNYHNNRTYRTLEELGVTVDFSAVPGLRTARAKARSDGENWFDWSVTPRLPFRPSRADYRRSARAGETASELLEVPNFVSTSRLWSTISGLQLARKMKDPGQIRQALRRPTYWIGLTGRPKLFAPLASQVRRSLRDPRSRPVVFVTYFHPDELLPNRSHLYRLEFLKDNLQTLLRVCVETGTEPRYIKASLIPDVWSAIGSAPIEQDNG